MPKALIKYEGYTRAEVHDIFDPQGIFTPQAGTWGLQGIVAIPDRPGDYVFFVTYGQKQGGHEFDEGITEDGVLTWQSQPKQRLVDRQIREFIGHNEDKNSIYLFLRTDDERPYTYLGQLKYLSHDTQREQPVYFKWQILEWDIPASTRERMGLVLTPGDDISPPAPSIFKQHVLQSVEPPPLRAKDEGRGEITFVFKGNKKADRSRQEAMNRKLGLAGEELVLRYERQQLTQGGREDLAAEVRHISVVEGDGAGYDIASFDKTGEPKYIEVKTTTGARESDFFVSAAEVAFSERHAERYHLYRVFNYDETRDTGEYYVLKGALTKEVTLVPTQFRARR